MLSLAFVNTIFKPLYPIPTHAFRGSPLIPSLLRLFSPGCDRISQQWHSAELSLLSRRCGEDEPGSLWFLVEEAHFSRVSSPLSEHMNNCTRSGSLADLLPRRSERKRKLHRAALHRENLKLFGFWQGREPLNLETPPLLQQKEAPSVVAGGADSLWAAILTIYACDSAIISGSKSVMWGSCDYFFFSQAKLSLFKSKISLAIAPLASQWNFAEVPSLSISR